MLYIYVQHEAAYRMEATTMLPQFTAEGILPPQDFPMTLDQLKDSMLVCGPRPSRERSTWDQTWRRRLVANLGVLAGQLWQARIERIFINGSFVEDKDHPHDIDGYFECEPVAFASGALEQRLNELDPNRCWTWDPRARLPFRGYPKRQLPMWHAYRVELYPHFPGLLAGQDRFGRPLEFPAWFRQRRSDGLPKGIIELVRHVT